MLELWSVFAALATLWMTGCSYRKSLSNGEQIKSKWHGV